jgi:hypothetical protein
MLPEEGVRVTVGALGTQGGTFKVVETVLDIWLAWSALAAVTKDVSVPVDLPDTP